MPTANTTDTETEKRRQRDRDLILLFLLLMEDTHANLVAKCTAYLTGAASLTSLSDALVTVLWAAHTQSTVLGRQLAGYGGQDDAGARQFAATVMDEQVPYLEGLVQDLAGGRYPLADGSVSPALSARLRLHAQRIRGTANDAWSQSLPADTLIEWRLGPNANHCPSCPVFAAGSPYRADSLPTTPGSADCICLSACRCSLVVVATGATGFPLD